MCQVCHYLVHNKLVSLLEPLATVQEHAGALSSIMYRKDLYICVSVGALCSVNVTSSDEQMCLNLVCVLFLKSIIK